MVEQVPFPGQGPGLEGLKDVLRGMRAGFPDLYFSIEEQIAEGDKVVTRFEWTGTHRGEFLGVAATGRSVKVWGMVIDRLQSGRIKDTRIIMDMLGLMMQLGVFPPPRFQCRLTVTAANPTIAFRVQSTQTNADFDNAIVLFAGSDGGKSPSRKLCLAMARFHSQFTSIAHIPPGSRAIRTKPN